MGSDFLLIVTLSRNSHSKLWEQSLTSTVTITLEEKKYIGNYLLNAVRIHTLLTFELFRKLTMSSHIPEVYILWV